jgi:outer membrane protein assembly factor BamB
MKTTSKALRACVSIALLSLAVSGCGALGGKGKRAKTPTLGERISILSSETAVSAEPALADVAIILPEAVVNTEWAQPGGNAAKMMGHVALGTSIGPAWSANVDGSTRTRRLAATPVAAEGKIFAVDTSAKLTAFDSRTGARLWVAQVGSGSSKGDSNSLFGGGVSFEDGKVYATNGLGDVVALNASNGTQIWKVRPAGPLRGAPTISGGNVYVVTQDNQLFALSAVDGAVGWTESASLELSGVFGAAAPAVAQGTVVAGFSSGELNAYRYENGRSLWADALSRTSISTTVASIADIDASPVIDRGRVFAIGQGGRMVSMELVTGQRLWETNLAGISTPWIAGEWVFVIDDQARLLCLARATGKVRWISQLKRYRKEKKRDGQITWTGPILAGGRLIVASSLGDVANLDPSTGAIQSVTKAGGDVYLPPIVANNTLYILANNGRLTAWR